MKNNTKRLSDVTREASTSRVSKFADQLMPAAPKPKIDTPKNAEADVEQPTDLPGVDLNQYITHQVVGKQSTKEQAKEQPKPTPASTSEASPKAERSRKSGGFTVDDVLNMPVKDGEVFNKMVRLTDSHHELLRLMAFTTRKPMNVIVHNLISLLEQAYQKEQKGGLNDA